MLSAADVGTLVSMSSQRFAGGPSSPMIIHLPAQYGVSEADPSERVTPLSRVPPHLIHASHLSFDLPAQNGGRELGIDIKHEITINNYVLTRCLQPHPLSLGRLIWQHRYVIHLSLAR